MQILNRKLFLILIFVLAFAVVPAMAQDVAPVETPDVTVVVPDGGTVIVPDSTGGVVAGLTQAAPWLALAIVVVAILFSIVKPILVNYLATKSPYVVRPGLSGFDEGLKTIEKGAAATIFPFDDVAASFLREQFDLMRAELEAKWKTELDAQTVTITRSINKHL